MFQKLKNYSRNDNLLFLEKTSSGQFVKLIKENDFLELYINNNLQWSESDEFIYHEALTLPYISYISKFKKNINVLILGGGDGFVVRELLKFEENINLIDLVDFDKELLNLHKTNENIIRLNENSLNNKKVNLIIQDAFKFVKEENLEIYDLIISDLVDPYDSYGFTNLYTKDFFESISKKLKNESIFISQIGCSIFKNELLKIVKSNINKNFDKTHYLYLPIPSFGYYNFFLYTKTYDISKIFLNETIITNSKFINNNLKVLPLIKGLDL